MKHLTEYRDGSKAKRLAAAIERIATRRWTLMEVCGGQTHSIIRHGIDQILPESIELIHGPGCPVCVTPIETIDRALQLAKQPGVIFCSFGDMLRVPGSDGNLLRVKAGGGDVRMVYSPLDAVRLATENPDRQVVFFAIGFETTAPACAMAIKLARQQRVANFSALVSHVLVPPAMEAIVQSDHSRIDAFLAAGHVCTITGLSDYRRLCQRCRVPVVATGFEPLDLLEGIRRAVWQLEHGRAEVENAYPRVVSEAGNPLAVAAVEEVFEVDDQRWRGIGVIPRSGLRVRGEFRELDANVRFPTDQPATPDCSACRAGEVLTGTLKPNECEAFGKTCTPQHPLGAPMVSGEGACAAYYNYGRLVAGPSLERNR
jgi:hydrogenase expression/formation protein HypD